LHGTKVRKTGSTLDFVAVQPADNVQAKKKMLPERKSQKFW
jgi:hypothetical protein